ncbi:hypothetical protein NE237_004580 [Protea cynaroides]|uniref:Uncharacterized protein n=1 Tax=Protea cynaroides TaxID=273540 RepID=A0A9Q0KJQ4_9MAGN|nr:hypothetical protein NE237_004580 [Protea cynaroides]
MRCWSPANRHWHSRCSCIDLRSHPVPLCFLGCSLGSISNAIPTSWMTKFIALTILVGATAGTGSLSSSLTPSSSSPCCLASHKQCTLLENITHGIKSRVAARLVAYGRESMGGEGEK